MNKKLPEQGRSTTDVHPVKSTNPEKRSGGRFPTPSIDRPGYTGQDVPTPEPGLAGFGIVATGVAPIADTQDLNSIQAPNPKGRDSQG